jgi:hypothetical protein
MTTPRRARHRRTLEVPVGVSMALSFLGAPVQQMTSTGQMVAWAEDALGFRLTCCGSTTRGRVTGYARHWVKVDPHTGATVPAPTAREAEKTDAVHLLWALSHDAEAPGCLRAGDALATWVGPVHPGWLAPWPRSAAATSLMREVRTVVRAVEYLDAGLDLHAHQPWLSIGAHPSTIAYTRDLLGTAGLDRHEPRLVEHLCHKVGLRGTLKVGQKAVSDTAWLNAVVEGWVRERR